MSLSFFEKAFRVRVFFNLLFMVDKPTFPLNEILKNLIQFGGTILGIILVAIGGIMFMSSTLKLYVFQYETARYQTEEHIYEQCVNEPYIRKTSYGEEASKDVTEPTEEEIKACTDRKTASAKKEYRRNETENMIEGFSFLFFGVLFWVVYRRHRKTNKK